MAVSYVPLLVFSWIAGEALPSSGLDFSFVEDIGTSVAWLAIVPTCMVLLLDYYRAVPEAIDCLAERRVSSIGFHGYASKEVFVSWRVTLAMLIPLAVLVVSFSTMLGTVAATAGRETWSFSERTSDLRGMLPNPSPCSVRTVIGAAGLQVLLQRNDSQRRLASRGNTAFPAPS